MQREAGGEHEREGEDRRGEGGRAKQSRVVASEKRPLTLEKKNF